MELIFQINQIRSNDDNTSCYRITIPQGAEKVNSEEILLENLIGTIPYKKGIIEITRKSNNVWEIETNK